MMCVSPKTLEVTEVLGEAKRARGRAGQVVYSVPVRTATGEHLLLQLTPETAGQLYAEVCEE
jgi:hypothetical protein